MELALTKRWVVQHRKTETLEIKDGQEVEYYGVKNRSINNPMIGTINSDENGFFIEWEDGASDTRIDGSDFSKEVLENCGFR